MQMSYHVKRFCAFVFAALMTIGSASATSWNTDVTDTWWNPNESGWGMQMVNTGKFAFATIYVYGGNGAPTWYTGQLNETGTVSDTEFVGPLYLTNGPYFGGPFNPNAVGQRQVGTMRFVLNTVETGQLTYSVDGGVVNKSVQRTPLTLDDYNGNYIVTYANTSNCAGNLTSNFPIKITQNGNSMTQVWSNLNTGTCTFNGRYSQRGRMGQFDATYSCTDGTSGNSVMYAMNNNMNTFTALTNLNVNGSVCTSDADIAGVIRQ